MSGGYQEAFDDALCRVGADPNAWVAQDLTKVEKSVPGDLTTRSLWIGSYPGPDGPGTGEGIWRVDLDDATGGLSALTRVVASPVPAFLAQHPSKPVLFAVREDARGEVRAFAIADDGLREVWCGSSGGTHPCHVAVSDDAALISNYGSGSFAALQLDEAGIPTGAAAVFEHSGSGPNSDRQEGPHMHSAGRVPGTDVLWAADLGTDQVWRFRQDGAVGADGIAAQLAPGSGPRHMAFDSGLAFVAGELDNSVTVLKVDPVTGQGRPLLSVPACQTTVESGAYPSHIALNAAGTRLFVAVRGPDVVGIFDVAQPPEAGEAPLTYVGETSVGGQWPRHFAIVPGAAEGNDRLVFANQNSNELVVIDVDRAGRGTERSRLELPVPPACVLPAG